MLSDVVNDDLVRFTKYMRAGRGVIEEHGIKVCNVTGKLATAYRVMK
jgi:hypothetical protein